MSKDFRVYSFEFADCFSGMIWRSFYEKVSALNATFSRSIFDALWKDRVFELLIAEWRLLMIFKDSSMSFDKLSLAFTSLPFS